MFVLSLIKNSKYFFTIMACMFVVFLIIILVVGRHVYANQRVKLYTSKTNELEMTRDNFQHRLDDVELEIRRIVNVMKQMDILDQPEETDVKSFVSDFLFDHHYLSIIIDNRKPPYLKVDSQTYPEKFRNFMAMPAEEIYSKLKPGFDNINKITISSEMGLVYLVKSLNDVTGVKDRNIIFFFSPDLLLKYLPRNYAFLMAGGGVKWVPADSDFPAGFSMRNDAVTAGNIPVNDTQTIFYAPLKNGNTDYYLAAVTNTSEIKKGLVYNTLITILIFTFFFALILFIIYFRNLQISQLINTQKATVVCLANLAEFKDNETADHLERTRHYGNLLSNYLRKYPRYKSRINKEYLDNIGFASVLHDIGKVGVPDSILKKPGRLDPDEFEIIKQHTVFARNILKELVDKHKINDIFFTLSYNIAAYHHEKWNGTGYPDGLKGEEIPLEARIFGLCDVYDALRSERVYKDPFSHEKSMAIINQGAGTHFDPDIVEAFNACAEQFRQIHDTYIMFYNEISYSTFGNNKRELKIEWSNNLSVGIEVIDDQHKVLLGKINFLIKSILEGKGDDNILSILNFLKNYSEEHFKAEEKIMMELNDPNLKEHVKEHEMFRRNFRKIIEQITTEGLRDNTLIQIEKYLITWLLDHIIEMDLKIKEKTA